MNLSAKFISNLLNRAYSYIDSGEYDVDEWSKKMKDFLIASNNNLLDFTEQEIDNIINEVWTTEYRTNNEVHKICEWANIKKDNTRFQMGMRNSMDRLFRAIDDFRSSAFFIEMLKFCARFKELAPYNAMMVKTQMPAAKYVLTEKKWKAKYQRRPKRNARPLVVLKKYGPVDYVFEIGDTEPMPQRQGSLFPISDEAILDALANPYGTTGTVSQELYNNLVNALGYYGIALDKFRVAVAFGAEIRKSPCKLDVDGIEANGHYVISVNDRADISVAFASICHELGHFFCHHLTAPKKGNEEWWTWRYLPWEEKEFEAEIVSYIICERFGVGNKSWEYLSKVIGKNGTIPEGISIDRIFKAANEVERMLDPDLDPRTCLLYFNDREFKKAYDTRFPKRNEEKEEE